MKTPFLLMVSLALAGLPLLLRADPAAIDPQKLVMDRQGEKEKITQQVRELYLHQSFDAIEAMQQELITKNSRLNYGLSKLPPFYLGMGPSGLRDDTAWQKHLQGLKDWRQAKPDSILADSVLGNALVDYAWFARGDGYADTITPEGGKQFDQRLTDARKTLEESYAKHHGGEIPPLWYSAILTVALGQGWTLSEYDRWFNEAIAKYPDYFDYYYSKAIFLLPRWYGQDGDWEKFAEMSGRDLGPEYYTRICWANSPYYNYGKIFQESKVRWEPMKAGFEQMESKYPTSLWNLNNFCHFACLAKDKETAKRLFNLIGGNWYKIPWASRKEFETYKSWATGGDQGQ